ncbi:MAG: glycosyltransferase [Thermodesulfovibrionales bacterium]
MLRILFLTHPYPNYVPDLLLHGLRKLLGERVIDYPRKECLYKGFLGTGVSDESQLLKGWFPKDDNIDREDIDKKIQKGFFTYVLCDLRAINTVLGGNLDIPKDLCFAIIDGEDTRQRIPLGNYLVFQRETDGSDYSIPLQMSMPEDVLNIIRNFDNVEKRYSVCFLGSAAHMSDDRISYITAIKERYSDALLNLTHIPTPQNPMPQGRLGRIDYYTALQSCKVVLNLKGAGYDTFRYWENCSTLSVHLSQNTPLLIPNDFIEGQHILRFSTVREMIDKIDMVLQDKINSTDMVQNCRNHLLKYHLTTKRAEYVLKKLKEVFG